MARCALALFAVLVGCHGLRPDRLVLLPPPVQLPGPRQIICISDLHFGLGTQSPGHWDPYEDARFSGEFEQFLNRVGSDGHGATDLILNGDTFELWQSRGGECASSDPDVGCSEAEALARFNVVAAAHRRELAALGAFARSGNNRVIIIPGNHDAALLFPAVAAAVERVAGAGGQRLQVARAGYFLSADARIFAEHGHQTGVDAANQLVGWPTPFINRPGGPFLRRPWGEQFVRDFFNRYEDKYPILDNIMPLSDAAEYGLASEQLSGGAAAAETFVQLLLKQTSPAQAAGLLLPYVGGLRWDLGKIRGAGDWLLGPIMLPPGDPLTAAVARVQAAGSFGRTVAKLTDSQITALCDRRWLQNALNQALDRPTVPGCPGLDGIDAAMTALNQRRDSALADHLNALNLALREQRGSKQLLQVFIYSHTHTAIDPYKLAIGPTSPTVVNSGAWQRTTGRGWLDSERRRRGLTVSATLPSLQLEDLPACYPLVRIAPYAAGTAPTPELLFFRESGGSWRLATDPCPN